MSVDLAIIDASLVVKALLPNAENAACQAALAKLPGIEPDPDQRKAKAAQIRNRIILAALAQGDSLFDPERPSWRPKTEFMCLRANARIADLRSSFDPASGMLLGLNKHDEAHNGSFDARTTGLDHLALAVAVDPGRLP